MSARTRLPRYHASAALAVVISALAGCSESPGGPEYSELGVRAADGSNVVLASACTPLPVLPGGTVERDLALAPGLSAHVLAVRDWAEVTLYGVEDQTDAHRSFPQETLHRGLAEMLNVTAETGTPYTVTFVAPCDATQMPP